MLHVPLVYGAYRGAPLTHKFPSSRALSLAAAAVADSIPQTVHISTWQTIFWHPKITLLPDSVPFQWQWHLLVLSAYARASEIRAYITKNSVQWIWNSRNGCWWNEILWLSFSPMNYLSVTRRLKTSTSSANGTNYKQLFSLLEA